MTLSSVPSVELCPGSVATEPIDGDLSKRTTTFLGERPMRTNLSRPWRTEEDERVLDLLHRGLTIKKIALKLRRTPRAVKTRAGHLKKNLMTPSKRQHVAS